MIEQHADWEFATQLPFDRALDGRVLWRRAGGRGIGLDLHCYTPDEFHRQLEGLGYGHFAAQRGELVEVTP